MLLEKVKEIKKAEETSAEKKQSVRVKTRNLTEKARRNGEKLIQDKESDADKKVLGFVADAEKKASEILERAVSDAKIEAVNKKVEAKSNINAAVKYVIDSILADFD